MVTVAAVLVAWGIGSSFSEVDALVAGILAIITLRPSVQASLSEGLVQILGTALGIGVALAGLALFGDTFLTVGIAAAAALTIARVLRLGEAGTMGIAVTALIIVGPGLSQATAIDRAWGTLIGVLSAVFFAFWAQPSTPLQRANSAIRDLSRDSAALLTEIAAGVQAGYTADEAGDWLLRARVLAQRCELVREQDTESVQWAKWSPLARRADAEETHASFVAVEHAIVQVRTIARSFYDAAQSGTTLPEPAVAAVSDALAAASDGLENAHPEATVQDEHLELMRHSSRVAIEAVMEEADSTQELLLGASVLSNVTRIAESVSADNPAITEVDTPAPSLTPVQDFAGAIGSGVRRVRRRRRQRPSTSSRK